MSMLGMAGLARKDGAEILAAGVEIAEAFGMVGDGWNGFNVLHTAAARVAGLDLGFVPGEGGRDVEAILTGAQDGGIEAVYLLGADEIDMNRLGEAFVIYQGHHGDAGAHRADVILPGAAYTEKEATYVNLEGRVQRTARAIFPPGEAREDWTILRALSAELGHALPYDSLAALRTRVADAAPSFAERGTVRPAAWQPFTATGQMLDAPFGAAVDDFYMTDPICRASETMAKCSTLYVSGGVKATGTDG